MVIRAVAKAPRPRVTVQTVGHYSYAIPDAAAKKPINQALMIGGTLLVLPLAIAVVAIWSTVMYLAPSRVRNPLLSRVIPMAMKAIEKRTLNQRRLLLQHVSGRVLDVGCGGGAYMSLLAGKATHIVALEPVDAMHSIIRENATKAGFADYQISVSTDSVETYSASNPTAAFDWIIFGNVLCEVDDMESTVAAVNVLLRPGGHVYFSEHLGGARQSSLRSFQNTINPWWRTVSGGCNCNRDSLQAIEGMASWEVASWEMTNLKVWGGPFVMGLARKFNTGV